jgi:hypothetical protein
VHEILKEYPVKMVVGGHTHEYVWEERDGINYVIVNSSGGPVITERGGNFHASLFVTAAADGEVHYAVIKPGSVLPLDTVNREERRSVTKYYIPGKALKVDGWEPGEPLTQKVVVPIENKLEESRLYRLDWTVPYGAEVTVDPPGMWLEIGPQETAEVAFVMSSSSAPEYDLMPWLNIKSEKTLRSGVVSRDWEARYREERETAEYPTNIPLDEPVEFSTQYTLFVPPEAVVKRRSGEVRIDGRIDEAAWDGALAIEELQTRGHAMIELENRVYLQYDADRLYVGVYMQEPSPEGMRAQAGPPIPLTWDDDDVELFFDTEQSQKDYIRLFQNVAGTRFNSLPRDVPDKYFESAYESAVYTGQDYWSIEMAIPWEDLRLESAPVPGEEWGFNIGRHRTQGEPGEFFWSGSLYDVKRYGVLRFE